jgi:hypothetical protein
LAHARNRRLARTEGRRGHHLEFRIVRRRGLIVVDGQQVTTSRGVTVGKSVGALLLFPAVIGS